jgi:hypothetical protein
MKSRAYDQGFMRNTSRRLNEEPRVISERANVRSVRFARSGSNKVGALN